MVLTLLHEVLGHFVAGRARPARADHDAEDRAGAARSSKAGRNYVERMMVDAGLRRRRSAACAWWSSAATMLRAARLVAAVRLHALGAKLDDVVKLFTDEAASTTTRRGARRSARRSIRWCWCDALGRLEIERLRDDWRAAHAGARWARSTTRSCARLAAGAGAAQDPAAARLGEAADVSSARRDVALGQLSRAAARAAGRRAGAPWK